jgi:hypothetical protein
MPDFVALFVAAGIVFAFGFSLGRSSAQEPSEEAMFNRLVRIRTNRKIRSTTKADLESDIDEAADALAR